MKYYSYARPIMPGGYPKVNGNVVIDIVNYGYRNYPDDSFSIPVWGCIEYEHEISLVEANNYELLPECAVKNSDVDLDVKFDYYVKHGINFAFVYSCDIRWKDVDSFVNDRTIVVCPYYVTESYLNEAGIFDDDVFFYDSEHSSPIEIDYEDFVVENCELVNCIVG